MATLIWNARGIGNKETLEYIKILKSQYNPMLLVILEPKIRGDRISIISRRLRYKHSLQCSPMNTHVWLFYDEHAVDTLVSDSSQMITVCITNGDSFSILASFVYAKCTRNERLEIWQDLEEVAVRFQEPWIVGGDFNIIVHSSEKLGRASQVVCIHGVITMKLGIRFGKGWTVS